MVDIDDVPIRTGLDLFCVVFLTQAEAEGKFLDTTAEYEGAGGGV